MLHFSFSFLEHLKDSDIRNTHYLVSSDNCHTTYSITFEIIYVRAEHIMSIKHLGECPQGINANKNKYRSRQVYTTCKPLHFEILMSEN